MSFLRGFLFWKINIFSIIQPRSTDVESILIQGSWIIYTIVEFFESLKLHMYSVQPRRNLRVEHNKRVASQLVTQHVWLLIACSPTYRTTTTTVHH